jgi:oligosaccharyltransferase complex subunit gamma
MRVLSLLALAILPATILCAKKETASRFDTLFQQSHSSTPLKLDDASYEQLTNIHRDYTAVVLLTALEARFGCQLCREFAPEWDILAKSWNKGDRKGVSRTIFATLDFSNGKATFQNV